MARELIVATNPKRRQSAKQRAASLRNLRKARAARGGRRRKSSKRRTTRSRRRNPSPAAPRRRRAATRNRRRAAPRRSYRNPARLIPRNLIQRTVIPAAIGGAGAVANDVAYSFLMGRLPVGAGAAGDIVTQLQTGPLRHVGKAFSALALGYLASFAINRRTAEQLSAGAITVVGYNVVREVLARVAPDLNLGAYIEPGMSAYLTDRGMGWPGAGRGAPGGTLNPRRGYRPTPGLAKYVRRGLRGLPQLTTRGQLTQPDPFTRGPVTMEGYGGY